MRHVPSLLGSSRRFWTGRTRLTFIASSSIRLWPAVTRRSPCCFDGLMGPERTVRKARSSARRSRSSGKKFEQKPVEAIRLVERDPVGALEPLVAPPALHPLLGSRHRILGQVEIAGAPDPQGVRLHHRELRPTGPAEECLQRRLARYQLSAGVSAPGSDSVLT